MSPILDQNTVEVISSSAEQTRRIGMRLGSLLRPGDVICLIGDLGAGKTTLVQGLVAGWGSLDPVSSPTFMLVNLYRRGDGHLIYHLDAYRLSGPSEALDLDMDEMLDGGILLVEWADRIESALPKDHLSTSLHAIGESRRDLFFSAKGERYRSLLADFRGEVFGVS